MIGTPVSGYLGWSAPVKLWPIALSRTLPYFSGLGVDAGFACTAANGDAAAVAFGLSCLGFFGSRPLRFCPLAICVLPKRGGRATPGCAQTAGRSPTGAALVLRGHRTAYSLPAGLGAFRAELPGSRCIIAGVQP